MFTRAVSLFALSAASLTCSMMLGCGATKPAVSVADETTPTVRAVRANEAQLVVDDAIVTRCSNVRQALQTPSNGPSAESWLAILGPVGTCASTGALGDAKLRVSGSTHSSEAVGVVLSRFGVSADRIRTVATPDDDACAIAHHCVLSTVKVDLVSPGEEADAVAAENR